VLSDPLAMLWGVRAHFRTSDGWKSTEAAGTRVSLPSSAPADYHLELLDEQQNVLGELGSATNPFHLRAAPAPSRRHNPSRDGVRGARSRRPAGGW